MNVTSDHFLKPSGSCLINKSNLMYVIIVFGFFPFQLLYVFNNMTNNLFTYSISQ